MSADPDLALLARAARAAGAEALKWRGALARGDILSKAGGEPVTSADLAADRVLQDVLRTGRPDYGWLSEESPDDGSRRTRECAFVVDPIDGTRAFIAGEPYFVISAAVIRDGAPVAGVLYQPVGDSLYEASAGGGARLDGAPLTVSDREDLAGARLLCPRRVLAEKKWMTPWPEDMAVESPNAMAYRIASVARGDWHGTLSLGGISDWDLAAADLIVTEAGGVITDLAGAPFRYNEERTRKLGVVCGGPGFHAALMARLEERRQDESHG